jgi:hypothetical protein
VVGNSLGSLSEEVARGQIEDRRRATLNSRIVDTEMVIEPIHLPIDELSRQKASTAEDSSDIGLLVGFQRERR